MAQSVNRSFREDLVHCVICSEDYNEPTLLPCLHSFCLKCLKRWASNSQAQPLSCPTCGCTVDLPDAGVGSLPQNVFLVSLAERVEEAGRLSKQRKDCSCDICRTNIGAMFCLDCKMHICSDCLGTHERLSRSRDHNMIPSHSLSDQTYLKKIMLTQAPYCTKHRQEKISFFCTQCEQLVCHVCALVCHIGHNLQEAEIKVKSVRANMQTILKESEIEISSILDKSKETERSAEEIKSKLSALLCDVDARYEQIVSKLQSDRKQLRQELFAIERRKSEYLQCINADISMWFKKMENNLETIRRILEEKNPWEMVQMERNIIWSYKKLQSDKSRVEMFPLPGKIAFTFIASDLGRVPHEFREKKPRNSINENFLGSLYKTWV
ncbi:E3 ubiquitin-protein ligase TRIM56 [Holothuria leucospilota]|uniref:E3 ubiquitin-protein ligase TRIM56 n=1 Tax=Holothuria leucospilota TaxID=206669 RepID=A0A9Q0YIA6_HOLLE|nr:E3 ubiquitin-protein ligase TRIM56 [Holothuria leucospilota]